MQQGCYYFQFYLFVCVFVRQPDNSSTVRDISTKFSGHHSVVKRADKFENGYCGAHGWWKNVSNVPVDDDMSVCMWCECRTEPVKFTKQEFDEDVVRRYLPRSRLSSGLLVVDESTYETIRQKYVITLYQPLLFTFTLLRKNM